MAKKLKKVAGQNTWRKKKWFKIVAPEFLRSEFIGETPSADPNTLVGKTTTVNLMNITRNMKDQNTNITFEITEIAGDSAKTAVRKLMLLPASVKRFVKRGKNRLDESFVCATSDGKNVRIKPLLITNNSTNRSTQSAVRDKMIDYFEKKLAKTKYDVFIQEVITKKFQKALRDILKKVYPLKICEIRSFVLLSEEALKKERLKKAAKKKRKKESRKKAKEETEEETEEIVTKQPEVTKEKKTEEISEQPELVTEKEDSEEVLEKKQEEITA